MSRIRKMFVDDGFYCGLVNIKCGLRRYSVRKFLQEFTITVKKDNTLTMTGKSEGKRLKHHYPETWHRLVKILWPDCISAYLPLGWRGHSDKHTIRLWHYGENSRAWQFKLHDGAMRGSKLWSELSFHHPTVKDAILKFLKQEPVEKETEPMDKIDYVVNAIEEHAKELKARIMMTRTEKPDILKDDDLVQRAIEESPKHLTEQVKYMNLEHQDYYARDMVRRLPVMVDAQKKVDAMFETSEQRIVDRRHDIDDKCTALMHRVRLGMVTPNAALKKMEEIKIK